MDHHRLLIVSNRLPVSVRVVDGAPRLAPASGGLATGLRPYHESSGGLWIGWPGDLSRYTPDTRRRIADELASMALVPVTLTREHIERFYHGFANRVLWPLFHYLVDRVPVDATGWEAYCQVNQAFADVVAREYRAGDTIWVHDYQLMLVPALVRQRLPEARIGSFLHIPFPSSEVFRVLPWRSELLGGLLGADLVGFHTHGYLRHFLSSLRHVGGPEPDIDRVRVGDRDVRAGVFPMGVDAAGFAELAESPEVQTRAEAIRREAGGRRIVLGVDRLDYTKGIPRRLYALERLWGRSPGLSDRVRYIQVAVPSRGEVDSYQRFKRLVEESVGRTNGVHGTVSSSPVHYLHQSVSPVELAALYCAADVMLVTPLRDGMNLVAKEFVASRRDERGVLVLSELAGAAAELDGALVVNPYDVEAVADTLDRALAMPAAEQKGRMATLRRRVFAYDVHAWAASFLEHLTALRAEGVAAPPEPALPAALAEARRFIPLRVLLDYDGTLVPLVRRPEQAAPDDDLRALLADLSKTAGLELHIVSGRDRQTMDGWLGDLPVSIWAEHGLWHRPGGGQPWRSTAAPDSAWIDRLVPIFKQFVEQTPGSAMEIKSASIGWHYRRASREFGDRQAHELRMLLGDVLTNQPLELIEGKKVIEVRLRGISKAIVGRSLRAQSGKGGRVVAFGDDRTDEDLFRSLPASSLTVVVGDGQSSARFRVDDHQEVRRLLRWLVDEAEAETGRPTRR
jgi:trehalose 6-phosphate synthase/phosphatase